MMSRMILAVCAALLAAAVTGPVLAHAVDTTSGATYGTHHATMAQEMTGFTGTMNPGVMHQGFSGWMGH